MDLSAKERERLKVLHELKLSHLRQVDHLSRQRLPDIWQKITYSDLRTEIMP